MKLTLVACASAITLNPTKIKYPSVVKDNVIDTYRTSHNTTVEVADSYRFLEDPNSPQTKMWTEAESALTEEFFAQNEDVSKINNTLQSVRMTEEVSIPFKVQDWFYFEYAAPEDEHSRLYRSKSDDLSFLQ